MKMSQEFYLRKTKEEWFGYVQNSIIENYSRDLLDKLAEPIISKLKWYKADLFGLRESGFTYSVWYDICVEVNYFDDIDSLALSDKYAQFLHKMCCEAIEQLSENEKRTLIVTNELFKDDLAAFESMPSDACLEDKYALDALYKHILFEAYCYELPFDYKKPIRSLREVAQECLDKINAGEVKMDFGGQAYIIDDPVMAVWKMLDDTGLTDNSYKSKIDAIRSKKIEDLTDSEICTYLSFIFQSEFIYGGTISGSIGKGIFGRLLQTLISNGED